MTASEFIQPLLGGVLIGIATSLFLWMNGRVFGVSGIFAGILNPQKGDTAWRVSILLGFLTAGLIIQFMNPSLLVGEAFDSTVRYILAGLLVGFGTQLGSGCTSGHGVCGMSRLSPRSLVATGTFMLVGILTVGVLRLFGSFS